MDQILGRHIEVDIFGVYSGASKFTVMDSQMGKKIYEDWTVASVLAEQ
jgi:hypothetical protein